MIPVERQQHILQLLAERGVVSIVELTDWLGLPRPSGATSRSWRSRGGVLSVSGRVSLPSGSRAGPPTPPSAAWSGGQAGHCPARRRPGEQKGHRLSGCRGTTSLELARGWRFRKT